MHSADSTVPTISEERRRKAIEESDLFFGFSRYKGQHLDLAVKCYLDPEAEAVALTEYLRNRGVAEEQIAGLKVRILSMFHPRR